MLTIVVLLGALAPADTEPTDERKAQLLERGRVVEARQVGSGVTDSWRLTLRDGELQHDAHFQSVDVHEMRKDLGGGRIEIDFVDSYRYNIAAYRLAELLGLDDLVPVSVERSWRGRRGAMTWWVDDVLMDENEMIEKNVKPPDPDAWGRSIYKVRVFHELVHDTDRNRGNVLVTEDWHIWMIDFTRAFRKWGKLRDADLLRRCDRELFAALKGLTEEGLDAELGDVLAGGEIEGLLARRDLLVEHYEALARELGEEYVFY